MRLAREPAIELDLTALVMFAGNFRVSVGEAQSRLAGPALALVNRGGTTTELLALAAEIKAGVRSAFGVELTPEPIIVGE